MKNIIRIFRKLFTHFNPVLSNKIMYRIQTGKHLNLKKPTTFNEKINWLKIYKYPYSADIIRCADKYEVRKYMKNMHFDKYLVPLIGSWDNVSEIDFEALPDKFVLKCNHGSKYNIVCNNKNSLNYEETKKKLNAWMKEDFGKVSGELHYSKIKRKIICEEFMGNNLIDLQVWCTYGKVLFIVYINSPHGINEKATFDENWNRLSFVTSLPEINKKIKKPNRLKEIVKISKAISKDKTFLRLDFYILGDGSVKFSEMTFSPASGFVKWNPSKYDYIIGNMIEIEEKL